MLHSLDTGDMDWDKLTAAVELADVKSAANIAAIAEHLGEFGFLPDAKDESDIGHFLVDNVDEYGMNIEMEDYFDFSGSRCDIRLRCVKSLRRWVDFISLSAKQKISQTRERFFHSLRQQNISQRLFACPIYNSLLT